MVNMNKISMSYIYVMRQHELKFACRIYTTTAKQVTKKNYPSANGLGYKNKVSARKESNRLIFFFLFFVSSEFFFFFLTASN